MKLLPILLALTISHAAPATKAAQNLALSLDGVGDYVFVPHDPSIDLDDGTFTIEFWFKMSPNASTSAFLAKAEDCFATLELLIRPSGRLEGFVRSTNTCALVGVQFTGPDLHDSMWHHTALVRSGADGQLYLDGRLVASTQGLVGSSNSSQPLMFGVHRDNGGGLKWFHSGLLDHIRLWSVARSEAEIVGTANTTITSLNIASFPNVVAVWNFEGVSDDEAGVNNGVLHGNPTYAVADDIPELDCDGNGVLDSEELASGIAMDCNANGVIDLCDLAADPALDFNQNGILDVCECLATNYCIASGNSTGPPAIMGYQGTFSLTNNDALLTAASAPPFKFGLFFYASTQTQLFLGEGALCVGPTVQRLQPIVVTDQQGAVSLPLDFTQPPFSTGSFAVTPFSTWNFQFWYRDPQGGPAGFNFSDGLEVTFCP